MSKNTEAPSRLARPTALMLTRIDERMSFLYLDKCQVNQDSFGFVANVQTDDGLRRTQIPIATITSILLGPGTSITNAAVKSASAAGCGISFVGSGAVRSYGAFLSPYAPTDRLLRQAAIVSDETLRLEAAKKMYSMRFPDFGAPGLKESSIERLRGIEGSRMKIVYQRNSSKNGLRNWKRNTGMDPSMGPMDPVNRALNSANSALYGVVDAVVQALGMSPGMGVIHTGNRKSFTLDVADLYKAETSIPLAFSLKDSDSPENDALDRLRDRLRLVRMIPRIVDDIDTVLGIETDSDEWDVDTLRLWGRAGEVEAGRSFASSWGD